MIKNKKGFTLIEMIVVLGVLTLVIPALFNVLLTIIHQQEKVIKLNEVKKQGDSLLQYIETKVRNNAQSMQMWDGGGNPYVCNADPLNPYGSQATFTNSFTFNNNGEPGGWFEFWFYENSDRVNYITPSTNVPLTKSNVLIDNYTYTCNRANSYSPATLTIFFTICYREYVGMQTCNDVSADRATKLDYRTTIQLREQTQ